MREAIIDCLTDKGWGYLRESTGEKWYFHLTNSPELKKLTGVRLLGARVQFELAPPHTPGRPDQAVKLHIVSLAPSVPTTIYANNGSKSVRVIAGLGGDE